MRPPSRPKPVSTALRPRPSPWPQTRRSWFVGTSLRSVASRSSTTGSTWTHATLTGRGMPRSLLRRAAAAAAGRVDPDHVAHPELARQLRWLLLAVHECPAAGAVLTAGPTRRRV